MYDEKLHESVNDTLGHTAGDKLIRDASHNICETFKHSPVFRVGGDEFVAILRGTDYEQRHRLMELMKEKNDVSIRTGGAAVACGFSEWVPGTDADVETVFERADAEMYRNKTSLKGSD